LLNKSGSLFFRFSLFVSFLGFALFGVCFRARFSSSLRGSLLRSPLRFLFLAPSSLFFPSRFVSAPLFRARVSLARCSSLAFALALFPFVLFCAFLRARFFVRVFSRSLFPCLFPSALFPSRSFPSARSAPVFRFVESV
jgi:hypothetical protein